MVNHLRSNGQLVHNRLLAHLPLEAFDNLQQYLEHVPLAAHARLIEPGKTMDHVYFPESGMVSRVVLLEGGATAEAGLVGNEGFIGIVLALGSSQTMGEAIVQIPGNALRMHAAALRKEVGVNAPLRLVLLNYIQALFIQVSQSVACNMHHALGQRLARWLLTANDCSKSNDVVLSHESLSMMLGVQRQSVTAAIGELKEAGTVATGHGRITILDRAKLEAASCECYRVVKNEYDRLLGSA